MTREWSNGEVKERRRRTRRGTDPTQLPPTAGLTPDVPTGLPRPNPQQSRGSAEEDPTPSAGSDERGRFELVRQRAYELYLRRGGAPGGDYDDWLEAERQIDVERSR